MITRWTKPLSRKALARPNFVYYLWKFVANGARTGRALASAASFPDVAPLARELSTEGIIVRPSSVFLTDEGQRALDVTTAAVLARSRSADVQQLAAGTADGGERQKEFLVHLVDYPRGIDPDDPILRVALDRKLLEIVAAYLGFWPSLYSIDAWLNYPTPRPPEISQLWHRDPEDLRLVKAFIYLAGVNDECGPFTYVPRTHPFGAETLTAAKLERKKRFEDDRMSRVFPPEAWRVCTGPAHTMILADTLGYHRGGKPTIGQRILITFTYTSGTPITERPVYVGAMPSWTASGIQRWAARPIVGANGGGSAKVKQRT